jgi:outer membrane lipoprotein-sorting protein
MDAAGSGHNVRESVPALSGGPPLIMEVGQMQGMRPTQATDDWDAEDRTTSPRRRMALRYVVPVAVAGVTAATVGLVPAFAGSGDPDLPKVSAEELVAKIAASDVQQMSGTVQITTDLGLPSLPGAGGDGHGPFGHGGPSRKDGGSGGNGDGGQSPADPRAKLMELASGSHTLRVAVDGPKKRRVSIIDDAAEYSVIRNGGEVWAYDSATNSAYHAKAPKGAKFRHGHMDRQGRRWDKQDRPDQGLRNTTPKGLAEQALKAVGKTTSVTVDGTARVAGRDAYQLLIQPKQQGTTVGSIRIAVDAKNGVPLKFTLSPKSGGKAVVDAGFTSVDFTKPDAKTFKFTPPKGATVTEQKDRAKATRKNHGALKDRRDWKDRRALRNHRDRGSHGPAVGMRMMPTGFLGGPGKQGMKIIGEGWTSVVQLKAPAHSAAPTDRPKAQGHSRPGGDGLPPETQKLMESLGDKVTGKFGSGRVFSTRLINVLVTDDGEIYAGAVDKATLLKAANEAK